jgi:hypothetical protein
LPFFLEIWRAGEPAGPFFRQRLGSWAGRLVRKFDVSLIESENGPFNV